MSRVNLRWVCQNDSAQIAKLFLITAGGVANYICNLIDP